MRISKSTSCAFHDFAQIECCATLSATQVGNVFRSKPEEARKIRCKTGFKGESPHRQLALDTNQEMTVVDFIRAEYASGNYKTRRDILKFVEREF
jgi:hypothetical protein